MRYTTSKTSLELKALATEIEKPVFNRGLLVHGHCSESGLHSFPSRSSRCPQFNTQILGIGKIGIKQICRSGTIHRLLNIWMSQRDLESTTGWLETVLTLVPHKYFVHHHSHSHFFPIIFILCFQYVTKRTFEYFYFQKISFFLSDCTVQ